MRILFFLIVVLLSVLWLYISFYFFKLDNIELVYSKAYDNMFFEFIFFVWFFVFGFFLWRFFSFTKKDEVIIKKQKIKKVEKKEYNDEVDNADENLKIIEWIGPKVEKLLKLNWINSLKDLSITGYDELKLILERAWDNFKIINPRSWPYQAELAINKEWGKLKEYQDFLIWWVDMKKIKK